MVLQLILSKLFHPHYLIWSLPCGVGAIIPISRVQQTEVQRQRTTCSNFPSHSGLELESNLHFLILCTVIFFLLLLPCLDTWDYIDTWIYLKEVEETAGLEIIEFFIEPIIENTMDFTIWFERWLISLQYYDKKWQRIWYRFSLEYRGALG